MAFDWKEFVSLGRRLHQDADHAIVPEALLRTAISRAYYGAFCHARNYAQAFLQFQASNDPDEHGRLRAHLKKRRANAAYCLDRLRQWRNESDYLDTLSFDDPHVVTGSALDEAEKVLAILTTPIQP